MATSYIPNHNVTAIKNLTAADISVSSSDSTKINTAISNRIYKEYLSGGQRQINSISYNWVSGKGDHIRFVSDSGAVWYINVSRI